MGLMDWRYAEKIVKEHFEEQGYTVLNQNNKGFPDLIVLKDGRVSFFVEVKAMESPDIKSYEVIQYHQYLERLGFEVKYINVRGEDLESFKIDYAEAIRDTYLSFEG